jgi:hypothetical protein
MVKTIVIEADTEQAITLDQRSAFCWVRNVGENDVYLSPRSGIVPQGDDVTFCGAGEGARVTLYGNKFYALGQTTIEVHPQTDAISPFM